MDIRNRRADIVKLRCNACQDLLKLVVKDNWQQLLFNRAYSEVENNGRFKSIYSPAYDSMVDKGINEYKIDDMDVTLISGILRGCKEIAEVSKPVLNALEQITDDRNTTNHSSENEDDDELYLLALLALVTLRNFIKTVFKFEKSIAEEKRLSYRKKYLASINELIDLIDGERTEYIKRTKEIDKNIQLILESPDPQDKWFKVFQEYSDKYYKIDRSQSNQELLNSFIVRASDAGISSAHHHAAIFFCYSRDISEAEKRIIKYYESIDKLVKPEVANVISLIDTFLEVNGSLTPKLQAIIDNIIQKGFSVIQNDLGYYNLEKKKK